VNDQIVYVAVGRGNARSEWASSPREAAQWFFQRFPLKKVCRVVEYSIEAGGTLSWQPGKHRFWNDVTKQQVDKILPDVGRMAA
jgi:hypothetical protein